MTWSIARPAPAKVAAPKLAPPSVILSSNLSENSRSQISATPSCKACKSQVWNDNFMSEGADCWGDVGLCLNFKMSAKMQLLPTPELRWIFPIWNRIGGGGGVGHSPLLEMTRIMMPF
jgi:hypothetical protein